MSEIRIATRYAKALLLCLSDDELETSGEALVSLVQLFDEPSVGKVLRSPIIPSDLKVQILENGLEQVSAPAIMKSFVRTLSAGGRVALLPHVSGAYERLVNERAGKVNVKVVSAAPVSQQGLDLLQSKLAKVLAKKIKLETEHDPAVLGGVILEMGNRKLDFSLRTKIERLAESAIS